LIEGNYIYACYARWTGLDCYRFDKNTGAGSSYGSVNPAGHSDLNYHHVAKIKEDVFYMKARVGDGRQWALFKFKGTPSQITDPMLWERIGYIVDDAPIAPSTCADGAIAFTYCTYMFTVYERYLTIACFNRCPTNAAERGNFSIFFFDTVKERLLAPDLSTVVDFGGHSLNPATKITITAGKPTATIHRAEPVPSILDQARRKAYGTGWWFTDAGTKVGILDIDLSARTAKYIDRPAPLPSSNAITADGKVIITEPNALRLYDPSTESITDITTVSGLQPEVRYICLHTEDVFKHVDTIISTDTHLILPPNWQDGLKVPKRIVVSSPAPNQLRVQAQLQLAPTNIRVRLWKIPDLTIAREETLAGATSIDRLYTGLAGGRYRAEVTAL
jgi:hypothetical protein